MDWRRDPGLTTQVQANCGFFAKAVGFQRLVVAWDTCSAVPSPKSSSQAVGKRPMQGNPIGRAAQSAERIASDLFPPRNRSRASTDQGGSPIRKDRANFGLLAGVVAALGLVFAGVAAAQAPLTIPVDAGGNPIVPEGMTLETVGVIETLAGTGAVSYGGDGGPASQASFRFPRGVAADTAGNIYIADSSDHRIRLIDSNGMIKTLAGTGESGYGGDGGPATLAHLNHPEGVAADGAGNVYFADSANHRVRKIDTTGMISTLAGTGERGDGGDDGPAVEARLSYPAGVAVDNEGNVYVADSWNHRVRKVDREGTITTLAGRGFRGYVGNGGPADQAALANPMGLSVDSEGNVYVADTWNHRVRRIDGSGVISTIAGSGRDGDSGDGRRALAASVGYPAAVATGPAGVVYVITYSFETANRRLRRIDPEGLIEAFAGTGPEGYGGDRGPAADAWLAYPMGVAADTDGNIYIADAYNARVRVVRRGFQVRIPLGESGDSVALVVAPGGELRIGGEPAAVGTTVESDTGNKYSLQKRDDGVIFAGYVPWTQALRVGRRAVTLTKQEDGTWRHGNEPAANGYRLSIGGRTYVLELAAGHWSLPEYVIETVAGGNTAVKERVAATAATVERPQDVAVDAAGNVYVVEATRPRVRKIDTSGVITTFAGTGEWGSSGDGGLATEAQLHWPRALALDAEGNLYVAAERGRRIRRINRSGVITTIAGNGECCDDGNGGSALDARISPQGLAVDRSGNLYIADGWDNVRKIDSSGMITAIVGTDGRRGFEGDGGAAIRALVDRPLGVAADQQGYVYIADYDNDRIRVIDPDGRITTFAGTGQRGFSGDGGPATQARLNRPYAVELDAAGNLYVADRGNRRVRKIDASGIITTFAGNGECCYRGDGRRRAVEARLNGPAGMAVDRAGNVYVATEYENRVLKIDTSGRISTLAGNGGPDSRDLDGIASNVLLENPGGVATLPSGDMVFADRNRVWRVDAAGTVVPFAGSRDWGYEGDGGLAVEAKMQWIDGLASDAAGNVYVTDFQNHRIRKIDSKGVISTLAGTGQRGYSGDGGPAAQARLERTCEIVADAVGNVYLAAWDGYRIRKIDTGGRISTIAGTGQRGSAGDGGPAVRAQLRNPCRGIAVDDQGNVYVSGGRRIRKIDSSGRITTVKELDRWDFWSEALAMDERGNLLIASRYRIFRMDADGKVSLIAGTSKRGYGGDGGPARAGGFSLSQMAVDRTGDIWLADEYSRRIRVLRKQRN